jgi:hypothetical protein
MTIVHFKKFYWAIALRPNIEREESYVWPDKMRKKTLTESYDLNVTIAFHLLSIRYMVLYRGLYERPGRRKKSTRLGVIDSCTSCIH